MRKLTILVDMDDTLENLCEVWVDQLSKLFLVDVTMDDIHEWDMTKAFPMLNPQEIYWPLRTAALWESVKPLPGAVEAIKKLKADGHKVVIVTASGPDSIPLKLKYCLFKYFPIKMDDVIIATQKDLIKGDIMIDDAPHNLRKFDGVRVLFSANHNRNCDVNAEDMIRVKDWNGTYELLSQIANKRIKRLKLFYKRKRNK